MITLLKLSEGIYRFDVDGEITIAVREGVAWMHWKPKESRIDYLIGKGTPSVFPKKYFKKRIKNVCK
jgi:hypothetical protein